MKIILLLLLMMMMMIILIYGKAVMSNIITTSPSIMSNIECITYLELQSQTTRFVESRSFGTITLTMTLLQTTISNIFNLSL